MKTDVRIKPIGVNNRLPLTQLDVPTPRDSTPVWMASAINVDLSGNSYLRRRRGFSLAVAGDWSSLWSDGADAYGVRTDETESNIYRLEAAGATVTTTLVAPSQFKAAVHYVRMPDGFVYVSDGATVGRITGSVYESLNMSAPNPVPVASVTAGGLPKGRYQVFFTTALGGGESCGSPALVIDVPENGGITFSGLTPDTNIYATGADGEIFNKIPLGDYLSLSNDGPECPTFMLQALPAGHSLCHYKGSMLAAVGRWLYISEPYRYGAYNPGRGFIPFPEDITVVVPCENGVYVCADKTYWLPGDPLDTEPKVALPYGALAGSAAFDEDEVAAFWQTKNGVIHGKPDGVVVAVQDEALEFRDAVLGHSWVREQDGDKHLVTTRFGAKL